MVSKIFNSVNLIFLLLSLVPANSFGDSLELVDFFAPGPGVKNTYSCEFPCEYIVLSGGATSDDNEIELTETLHFSDKLIKKHPKMPKYTVTQIMLHLQNDQIIKGANKTGSIMLKTPIKKGTSWKLGGIMGVVKNQKKLSNLEPIKISWNCSIVKINKENLFMKDKTVVTVKCLTGHPPEEVIWWQYASVVGLVENKTEHEMESGQVVKKMIMSIIKHEGRAQETRNRE